MTGQTRLDDLDCPLHRIFPVWFLEQAIRFRQLTLVKPALWPDPREDPCSTFVLESQSNPKRRQQLLSAYLAPCWAQCWSYEADSDVLLRAESMLVKLAIFRHEDEVRLLCIGTGRHNDGNNLKTMPIDPNFLFTEVRFDPRLALFERREREERLRAWAFTGKFIEDPSHTKTFTIIPMPGEWPDAPA